MTPRARRAPAKTTKTAKPGFDRDALLAERDEAVQSALYEAADLTSLTAALRRAVEANIRLRVQHMRGTLFDKFELRYEDRSFGGDSYATLYLTFKVSTEFAQGAPYVPESDAFEGLPKINNWVRQGRSVLQHGQEAWSGSFLFKRPTAAHTKTFTMFELTVAQMRATAQAWSAAQDALVAQEQLRATKTAKSPEAKALAKLQELEAKHAALTQELELLNEQLESARREVDLVRNGFKQKVAAKAPPVLKQLNVLREQLGLAPL
jgi:hypothetical protein